MSENDIFNHTGETYLWLIHPVTAQDSYQSVIPALLVLAPVVHRDTVSRMIRGASWRERLIGLSLAMAKYPETFVTEMLDSLRDVRGISIVPTCAALAVLARRGLCDAKLLSDAPVDRSNFDGEVGWAIDRAVQWTQMQAVGNFERGPNFGQNFTHHVELYEWIINHQQGGTVNES